MVLKSLILQGFKSFPEHPADRVRDIRFAGAVRTDDRGHAAEKFDLRAVGKRLEPL